MPKVIYFEHAATKKRYQLVSRDTAAGTITLQGKHGQFVETYSKERMQELGYRMLQVDEPDAEEADDE